MATKYRNTDDGVKWQESGAVSFDRQPKDFVKFRNTSAVKWDRDSTMSFPRTVFNSLFEAKYSTAVVSLAVEGIYSIFGPVYKSITGVYSLSADIAKTIQGVYDLLAKTVLIKSVNVQYSIVDNSTITHDHTVTATVSGVVLNVHSLSVSCDESSYCFALSMSLNDYNSWAACTAGSTVAVVINNDTFGFVIDARNRQRSYNDTIYTVTGRSATKALDLPDAETVTQEYGATTAETIATALCTAAGLTLDWRVVDWAIPANTFTAEAQSPLDIIRTLAIAAGGVVQTDKAGTELIVRYAFPVSPTTYADQTPALTLTDTDDIFNLTEQYETRKGFNRVRLSDREISDDTADFIYIELDDTRNNNRTIFKTTESVYIRVYSNKAYDCQVTAGSITKIASAETATLPESLETFVREEEPQLARPITSITSIDWYGTGLGTVSKIDSTKIRASGAGAATIGIGTVLYTSTYDVWELRAPAGDPDEFYVYILSEQD